MSRLIGATYFSDAFTRQKTLVEFARGSLAKVNFDTFVGTGLSGTCAVPLLAYALEKNFLIVRKTIDGTHSSSLVEGVAGNRWVFVDDLISSGSTFTRVYNAMEEHVGIEFVGAYMYQSGQFGSWITPAGMLNTYGRNALPQRLVKKLEG
jgi:orotate phosphoribosyltransferase